MSSLAGTWPLVRLALRVDRLRLPTWVGAIVLVVVVTAVGFAGLYPDPASRQVLASSIGTNPALLALYGPLYGPDTIGGLTAWRQGVFGLVLVSLMSLLTVVRHTRAAEETGRLELVGAAVVGRRAPLAAALLTAILADAAIAGGVTVGLVAVGESPAGSLAFGLGLAGAGLVFAAVAAVTAQATDNARTASGLAGAGVAAAFVLRAAGDAATGRDLAWLSWTSPFGWAQRVRAFADERWWVLGLLVALAVLTTVVADRLLAHRDLGSGLFPPRPGPPRAAPRLATPVALAWRLQRTTLAWWAVGMAVLGVVFGGVVDAITQLLEDTPQLALVLERLGGTSRIIDAFLGAILSLFAVLVSVHAVGAALRLRGEEVGLRAEQVLATAVTRWRWAASHLVVAALAPALLLLVGGAAAGLASGLVTGSGAGDVVRVAMAALAHLPAVWVVLGLTVVALGLLPGSTALAYGALAGFVLLGQVGEALQLDQVWLDLSPFVHVPALPGAGMDWTPLLWLTAVAGALTAVGLVGLRRRDLAP